MRVSNYERYSSLYSSNTDRSVKKELKKSAYGDRKTGLMDKIELSSICKNKDSIMPKEIADKICEFAKKDAKIGVYMTPEYRAFELAYRKTKAPDRNALKAEAAPLFSDISYKNIISDFFKMWGLVPTKSLNISLGNENFSATKRLNYISIKDEGGAEVLSWDENNGWLERTSTKEFNFHRAATTLYAEAYSAARKEMRANGEIM